ncbi:melatonin-related receptor-like [Maniola hyperantus]|uniref:melatonin-related receptor-like n=1 Tax=Aphantopus hyperantus TaxID=2795564 RepID=UPI00156A399D|nr:neuropeptide FF receptor 1-like [Maniola hyperantus]
MVGIHNGSYQSVYHQGAYSPLMLNNNWPRVLRLLFMLFCACFGSIMNGFFVSSFFVERHLKRIGNIYLACAGLSDLLVTAGVMPISAVVLLSGQWDDLQVCRTAQITAQTATYAYAWFFMMVAGENFYWICRSVDQVMMFLHMRIAPISFLIFCLSFTLAAVGVLFNLDYDYCTRQSLGNPSFRFFTSVIFYGIFPVFTMGCLIAAILRLKRRAREEVQYRRSRIYRREYSFTALNLMAYVQFLVSWMPYWVIVNKFPSTSDAQYYNTVWTGLFRSVFVSFIYGISNRYFRRAYARIYKYCCCKRTLSVSFASRHRRTLEQTTTTGEPSGHVMHQAVTSNSPYRGTLVLQETQI